MKSSSLASSLSIKFKEENDSEMQFKSNQSTPMLSNRKSIEKIIPLHKLNGAPNYNQFSEDDFHNNELINEENGKLNRIIVIPSFSDNIKAILIYVLSNFLYALQFVIQKLFFAFLFNASYGQQSIIKGLVLMAINYYLIRKNNEKYIFDTRLNFLLARRIFFGGFGEFLLLLSTNYMRINTSSIFLILTNVVACLFVNFFTGEIVKRRDIIIACACFLSASLIVKPFFGEGRDTFVGILMGVGVCFSYCSAILHQKIIGDRVTINVLNFYFGVCFLILGIMIFFYESSSWDYSFITLICHIAFGVMNYFAIITTVKAIIMGKLSYVLPFGNTNVVFAILMGYFILGEKVDALDVIGTILVLGICVIRSLLIIYEEKDLSIQ